LEEIIIIRLLMEAAVVVEAVEELSYYNHLMLQLLQVHGMQ